MARVGRTLKRVALTILIVIEVMPFVAAGPLGFGAAPLPAAGTPVTRVIRYDRVGYGHSDRRRDDAEHRVDVNGLELAQLIDVLHLDRVVLAGWSYGGGVAIDATGRSSRVTGVALLGSIGPATPPPLQVPGAVEWPRRWAVASGLPARAGILVFARLAFNASPPAGFASHARSVIGASGVVHTWTEEARQMDPASLSVSPSRTLPCVWFMARRMPSRP